MSSHAPLSNPAISKTQKALAIALGLIQVIAQGLAAMHPDWGWINAWMIVISAIALIGVTFWWAWSVAEHSDSISIRVRQWLFAGTTATLMILLCTTVTMVVNGAPLTDLIFNEAPVGIWSLTISPKAFANKVELRVHFDGRGQSRNTYFEDVLRGYVQGTDIEFTQPTAPPGSSAAKPAHFPQTHIVVLFARPINITNSDQIQVTFSKDNAPTFKVRDFGPYWVIVYAFGPVPEGDLDIFVKGDALAVTKIP